MSFFCILFPFEQFVIRYLLSSDLDLIYGSFSTTLNQVKALVLGHVYFWEKIDRTLFFVYRVPKAFKHPDFRTRVEELLSVPADWNLISDYSGLLTAMNDYRQSIKIKAKKYKGGKYHYVKFVSGAYTHEEELKEDGKIIHDVVVDDVFTFATPRLCFQLVSIVKDLGF